MVCHPDSYWKFSRYIPKVNSFHILKYGKPIDFLYTSSLNCSLVNYIVFDLEATCWETPPPGYEQEIIEIGAIRINQYGEVRGSFDRFVQPLRHPRLSLYCRNLTNITQRDIDRADDFETVIDEFIEWGHIDDESYTLISWGNFDKKMLAQDCIRFKLDYEWAFQHINLKESYRLLTRKKKAMGLRKACEREGIDFTGMQHRAISDAENLAKLFLKHLGLWSF